MIFVIDASPLIAFYSENELNEPELLHSLVANYCQLLIPEAVYEEIKAGRKATYSILSKAIEEGNITINKEISLEETKVFGNRYPRLHNGELQVLLLGLRLKSRNSTPFCCIIDEEPARAIAEKYSIPLKGTIGLIKYIRSIDIIDDKKMESLLYKLNHCNFRL